MNRRQAIAAMGAWTLLPAAAAAGVREDMTILRRALALHPGLHRYATPAEIEGRLDRLDRDFTAAVTLAERYLVLSRFLATIRCGHSYCNFFNQRQSVADALFDRPTRLPFHFAWIDRRMIVTADPSRIGIDVGTEVVSVNGVTARDMLAAVLPYARADGHNDAKRIALNAVQGSDRIEYFDVFHGLIFGAPPGGSHDLALRFPDGREGRREVPAIGRAGRQAQMVPRDYQGDEPVWTWSMRPDGIAVMTMPGWALYGSRWNWRQWLSDRLDSLHGARGLIVDLRENEGGEDCGDLLLARLADRPILDPGAERLVRFVRTPTDLDAYLDTWDESFRTLGVGAQPIGDGFLRLSGDRADGTIVPAGPRIELPVAALIGPVNSSATFQFALKAKRSGLIRLFGEPTGGNQRGINGGCFFFVRLPESGIEFDLPLIGYFPPGSLPDAGVPPDELVPRTIPEIIAGGDGAMTRAAAWISLKS